MTETVLVTGGTGLIGKVLVKALAEQGYRVVFTSRSPEKIKAAEAENAQITGYVCDFSQPEAVSLLLEQLAEAGEAVHHLVNNYRDADNLKTDEEGNPSPVQWQREFEAAVIVPYQLATGLTRLGNLKNVINISSIYGITAANMTLYDWQKAHSPIHYSVAKAAENHLTRELAVRLSPDGVKVNAVAFGGVKGKAPPEFERKYQDCCPYKGMLETEDVPGVVVFLLSAAAGAITGQVLAADGGWTIW